jgi:hypothetical protein
MEDQSTNIKQKICSRLKLKEIINAMSTSETNERNITSAADKKAIEPEVNHARSFGYMVADQMILLVAGTLVFLAALAWNSAAQEELNKKKSLKHGGPWVFAIIVTILAILFGASLAYIRKEFILTNKGTNQFDLIKV